MSKQVKASYCKCCECGAQAVAFWPCIDPDIPSHPLLPEVSRQGTDETNDRNI